MGHPFKEEIVAIEELARKQVRIGDAIGYRFKSEADESFYRNALNDLIKAHKSDRDYKSGESDTAKWVSMFIPFEIDGHREFGVRLTVQFSKPGKFVAVEFERASRHAVLGRHRD